MTGPNPPLFQEVAAMFAVFHAEQSGALTGALQIALGSLPGADQCIAWTT